MKTTTTVSYETMTDAAPSERVVAAVAELEDTGPTDLPPLYGAIDPEALDALYRSAGDEQDSDSGVCFTYCGYDVQVTFDGQLSVSQVE